MPELQAASISNRGDELFDQFTERHDAVLAEQEGFPAPATVVRAGPLRIRSQVEDPAKTWQRRSGRPWPTRAKTSTTSAQGVVQ